MRTAEPRPLTQHSFTAQEEKLRFWSGARFINARAEDPEWAVAVAESETGAA
jgi:hypothetical protein